MPTLNFIESDDDSQIALQGEIVLKVGNSLYDRLSTPNPDGNVVQRGGQAGHKSARRRGYPQGDVTHPIVPVREKV